MKKILHIVSYLKINQGGLAEATLQISNALVKEGINSEILCLGADKNMIERSFSPIHIIKHNMFKYWLKNNLEGYTAIIVHGIWNYTTRRAYPILVKKKIPYFIYPHGMLDCWFRNTYPLKHIKKKLYWEVIGRDMLEKAKGIIFTSSEENNRIDKSFSFNKGRCYIIELGIAPPEFNKNNVDNILFQQYPQLKNTDIILFLGRLHPKKGCDLLIRAFSLVYSIFPRLSLVIVGTGKRTYVSTLKSLVRTFNLNENVFFLGNVTKNYVWGLLRNTDILVLPSFQENFSFSLVESLAMKVPVLTTYNVGIWKYIKEEKAGFICNPSISELRDLLINWIELSEEKKTVIRENAHKCFCKYFRINNKIKKLLNLLT